VILVTGATGSIGRHLVTRLRQQRVPFRALVRSQEKGQELGCDFAVGDFDDPGSVARALRDVDRLLLNAGGAVSYIDCYDIAACAAALLTGPGRNAESFVLTGPEPLTCADVAEGSLAATTPAVRDLAGRAPRTFDQFIAANLQALQAAFGHAPVQDQARP
jgi:uncharacterized protein YbjT (DUF2867 family)